jgi:hypothetical protein
MPSTTKVHTRIGHDRSLCGLTPRNGHAESIKPFGEFFAAADEAQCMKCLQKVADRGYKLTELRKRYRSPAQASTAPLPIVDSQPVQPDEFWHAYRKAHLREAGITLLKALTDPEISARINRHAIAARHAVHTSATTQGDRQ